MKQILLIMLFSTFLFACGNSQNSQNAQNKEIATNVESNKNCIEVLCFHSRQRCVTCRAIESLTKEVLDSCYANEQKLGNIVFKVIDISQEANAQIANKYKVTWSSLILHKGENVENLTKMAFSYAKNSPEAFKSKLKESLDKMLQ